MQATEELEPFGVQALHADTDAIHAYRSQRVAAFAIEARGVTLDRDLDVVGSVRDQFANAREHAAELRGFPERRRAAAKEHAHQTHLAERAAAPFELGDHRVGVGRVGQGAALRGHAQEIAIRALFEAPRKMHVHAEIARAARRGGWRCQAGRSHPASVTRVSGEAKARIERLAAARRCFAQIR